jgi:uncharacterized membrane protein
MAGKDNYVVSDEAINGLNKGIRTGSFGVRITAYAMMYIPIVLILALLVGISGDGKLGINGRDFYFHLFKVLKYGTLFLLTLLPFYFIEKRIRARRKAEGLSVMGDITEELKQKATNERIAREMKARDNLGAVDKDLKYYHELLKSGAITQDEYDKKKQEIL